MSIFSGIEAASVAWGPLGWEPVAFSEIEAFPSAVLKNRYPQVPNLGDITQIDWSKHSECVSADVLVGGSPCQSFSIAGSRTGLAGSSGLMWEYVRAVRELRPRWLVWENVPGALSSSHGEDFACLLRALDGLGYGLAWRVLDAQYYGVAQRRRRVYLVGSLGNAGACDVLFEPDCLRWDHPTSREKRQALAGQAQAGAGGADDGGGCLTPWDTQSRRIYRPDGAWPTLDTRARSGGDGRAVALDYHPQDSRIRYADEDVSQTLSARMGTGGNNVPLVQEAKSVAFLPNAGHRAGSIAVSEELSPTLKTDHNPAVHMPATLQIRGGKPGGGKGALVQEDMSATLTAAQTQTLFPGDGTVRRLTPVECERLQGFPSVVDLETEEMTSDELIAVALANKDIYCNFETGQVFGTRGPGGMKLSKPVELGFKHPSGYIHVSLHAGGEKKQVRAHRIIYIASYGKIPEGCVIDHINGDKADNRLCNLQMMTSEGNSRKARMDGAYLTGDANPATKLSAEVRKHIVKDYAAGGCTYRQLAAKYGISKSRIGQIVKESGWTDVPYRGKDHAPDSPRYKAIGNSMAVPVMAWIGRRIQQTEEGCYDVA
ncbi:DNA (cytosine-5-)-methyltransferase [Bifidobacterium choladohabitans]|uniref:DNA (cytosine-5-)-methyltransferase n=1 Tax=Bifidobacterium choladohabitans TaxID=2750947 RepID=UPI0018DD2C8F